MRISEIAVTGLFGMFDHTVSLNTSDRITIVYGPNGFGKTYLLNLVSDLFGMRFERIAEVPFKTFTVILDDGRRIVVTRTDDGSTGIASITIAGSDGIPEQISTEAFTAEFAGMVPVRFINTERLMQYSDVTPDRPMITHCAALIRDRQRDDSEVTARKLDTLLGIINSRFQHKTMFLDRDTGFTFTTSAGVSLSPWQLSSGEQHAVIILVELLFNIRPDTLILIDEPELSLHIYWQQQFIRDIEAVIGFDAFDVLIATHSPQIIHDRWDLTVELKGPDA